MKDLQIHTVVEDSTESMCWRWSRLSLALTISKCPSYFMISFWLMYLQPGTQDQTLRLLVVPRASRVSPSRPRLLPQDEDLRMSLAGASCCQSSRIYPPRPARCMLFLCSEAQGREGNVQMGRWNVLNPGLHRVHVGSRFLLLPSYSSPRDSPTFLPSLPSKYSNPSRMDFPGLPSPPE